MPTGAGGAPPVRARVHGFGWRHAGRRSWALRGVDLSLEPGERVLLLGPSGAGKSTLLTALAGLLDPSDAGEQEGTVTLDGRPAREARTRAGLVLQDPQAALVMSRAGDDVAFGLENRGVPAADIWPRVDAALRAVGFPYGRAAATGALSGGEQQRLGLAGIVALQPGLLLLDEVTANLDPAGVALVHEALGNVLDATGATAVMVEHRVATVLDLVGRAVVLEPGGGVVADGAPAAVFQRYGEALARRGVWVPGREPVVRRRATRSGGPALVSAERATRRYPATDASGERVVLPPTSVALRAGRALLVTGPNGAGKSTLALLLAGLLRPSGGEVRGEPALGGPPHDRQLWRWRGRDLARAVGTVFQDPEHQFVASTVRAEMLAGPRQLGPAEAAARVRADELLDRLGLAQLADANPFTLSGGEKRRLSVATAIATAPPVVITDEPTFGQDPRTWAELVTLLADLRDSGCAVVAVTHDEALVDALADARLRLDGPPDGPPDRPLDRPLDGPLDRPLDGPR